MAYIGDATIDGSSQLATLQSTAPPLRSQLLMQGEKIRFRSRDGSRPDVSGTS